MCVFCKIVNKEIPATIVYEDDLSIAILDINPLTKGHTLVMPKEHYEDLLDCPKELLKHLIEVSQIVANKIINDNDAKGINLVQNSKVEAGQEVFHLHFHLIPRYHENELTPFKRNEMGFMFAVG